MMPVINGWDATKILKEKYPNIYIIACTANAFDEAYQYCYDCGFDNIIVKPMTVNDLEYYINNN